MSQESRVTGGPRQVARDDLFSRRHAARVAVKATVRWWLLWAAMLVVLVEATVALLLHSRILGVLSLANAGLVVFTVLRIGWTVRRARLYFLNNGCAEAVIALKPDPGDTRTWVAFNFLALPRGREAGTKLGEFVLDDTMRRRERLVALALPAMAARYQDKGMVATGRRWFWIRVESRPLTPDDEMPEHPDNSK